ncbi:MAG: sigma 54-interacting transcriptional regulator [Thermodesulfovibrionales bacterium]|nr:sigma 54-interacting transcriptional regulator [Thermodesulfovibrionales bacterium]
MEKELLIIDGDETVALGIKGIKMSEGWKVSAKKRLSSGLKAVSGGSQIVLLASALPDGDGIDGLRQIKAYYPDAMVIVMVPEAGGKDAVDAMRAGAYSVIGRPASQDMLEVSLQRAAECIVFKDEIRRLKTENIRPPAVICKSPEMLKVLKQVEKFSSNDEPVFISGEEGTGRELLARLIHFQSSKRAGAFISADAETISEEGDRISQAKKGTLFIKGIEGLAPARQEKLLRLVAESEFSRPPGSEAGEIDVRLIFSLNNNSGFDWVNLKVPPLRKRREDIPLLARHFLKETGEVFKAGPRRLSKEAEKALSDYEWPGNVTELKSAVRKAYIISKDGVIRRQDLLSEGIGSIREFLESKLSRYLRDAAGRGNSNLYNTVISEAEKALIEIALKETGGNRLKAASILGISRNTLGAKVKAYGIKTKETEGS